MKATMTLMLLALGFQSVTARADHNAPLGSIRALHDQAHQLDNAVQYSYLSYRVKQVVSRLAYDVSRFYQCTGGNPADDHDLVPGTCYGPLRSIQQSFYQVDRYLYDTGYDYPYIYQQYRRVGSLLRSVAGTGLGGGNGGPGGGNGGGHGGGEPDPDPIRNRP